MKKSQHLTFRCSYWLLLLLGQICGCQHTKQVEISQEALNQCVAEVRNQDIRWDGTYIGLLPDVSGPTSRRLIDLRDQRAIPLLIRALTNNDQFVAAHVILTQLTGFRTQSNAEQWNDLHVTLYADGRADDLTTDKAHLKERWQAWWRRGK